MSMNEDELLIADCFCCRELEFFLFCMSQSRVLSALWSSGNCFDLMARLLCDARVIT